ncbi:MAG: hypothetical protein AB1449_11020 [Chloroflexota bacterium]
MPEVRRALRIAVVGPCAAGKSTLVDGLRRHGHRAKQVVQEHSFVPDMWRVFSRPDVLIFLDASYEVCTRRKNLNWTREEHAEQLRRLDHARRHCDLYLHTDDLSPAEVLARVLDHLDSPEGR